MIISINYERSLERVIWNLELTSLFSFGVCFVVAADVIFVYFNDNPTPFVGALLELIENESLCKMHLDISLLKPTVYKLIITDLAIDWFIQIRFIGKSENTIN